MAASGAQARAAKTTGPFPACALVHVKAPAEKRGGGRIIFADFQPRLPQKAGRRNASGKNGSFHAHDDSRAMTWRAPEKARAEKLEARLERVEMPGLAEKKVPAKNQAAAWMPIPLFDRLPETPLAKDGENISASALQAFEFGGKSDGLARGGRQADSPLALQGARGMAIAEKIERLLKQAQLGEAWQVFDQGAIESSFRSRAELGRGAAASGSASASGSGKASETPAGEANKTTPSGIGAQEITASASPAKAAVNTHASAVSQAKAKAAGKARIPIAVASPWGFAPKTAWGVMVVEEKTSFAAAAGKASAMASFVVKAAASKAKGSGEWINEGAGYLGGRHPLWPASNTAYVFELLRAAYAHLSYMGHKLVQHGEMAVYGKDKFFK